MIDKDNWQTDFQLSRRQKWSRCAGPLHFEVLFSQINANTKGAPGYPPLTMFKIILLQQWSASQNAVGSRDRRFYSRAWAC